jgi:hypothetical protein
MGFFSGADTLTAWIIFSAVQVGDAILCKDWLQNTTASPI